MESFLIRLLIAIGVIWLVQILLDLFEIKEPARKILFGITVIVAVLFVLGLSLLKLL